MAKKKRNAHQYALSAKTLSKRVVLDTSMRQFWHGQFAAYPAWWTYERLSEAALMDGDNSLKRAACEALETKGLAPLLIDWPTEIELLLDDLSEACKKLHRKWKV